MNKVDDDFSLFVILYKKWSIYGCVLLCYFILFYFILLYDLYITL